jgi:hypothetical protein
MKGIHAEVRAMPEKTDATTKELREELAAAEGHLSGSTALDLADVTAFVCEPVRPTVAELLERS